MHVAQNPFLQWLPSHARKAARTRDADLLRQYATGTNRDLRQAAVYNKNLPLDLLLRLTFDYEWGVRAAVWNRATLIPLPVEVLQAVMEAPENPYRNQIPEQPNCTREMFRRLWAETDVLSVRAKIAARTDDLEILSQAVKDRTAKVREAVACNPHHTPEMAERLKDDKAISVLLALASRSSDPDVVRHIYVTRSDQSVKEAVASNPCTPRDILLDLAASPSGWIGHTFVRRRPYDFDLLRLVVQHSTGYGLDEVMIRESGLPLLEKAAIAAHSRSIRVRECLLKGATVEELSVMASSDDETVRFYASKHLVKASLA